MGAIVKTTATKCIHNLSASTTGANGIGLWYWSEDCVASGGDAAGLSFEIPSSPLSESM